MKMKQFRSVEIHTLPDAYILSNRHIDGQDGSLIVAMSPLARQVLQEHGVTPCDAFTVATFVAMDYICHAVAILESEGLELSEL